MLGRRLISAAVMIFIILLVLGLDYWLGRDEGMGRPGLVLALLGLATAALVSGEFSQLIANATGRVNRLALLLASMAMVAVACVPVLWRDYPVDCPLGRFGFVFCGLIVGVVILMAAAMLHFHRGAAHGHGEIIDRLGRGVFALMYLQMLIGFLLPHRFLQQDNGMGLLALVTLITTVKLSDATAYFTGKAFGSWKLAPRLSPGKTIQGSIGGLVGGVAGTGICIFAVAPLVFGQSPPQSGGWVLIYGLLITLAGMFGDLAESLLKRDSNTKDSSRWLPGLGGILDVIDSLVFAAPVSYLLWIV